MILLWGMSGDRPLGAVHEALRRSFAKVTLLDQRDVLSTEVTLSVDVDKALRGEIRTRDDRIDLASITSVYLRQYDARRLPAVATMPDGNSHVDAVEGMLSAWVEEVDCRVLNKPSAMAGNNSKPNQTRQLAALGFSVPATLITTEPVAARAFWGRHEDVVYKSISSVRSVVSRLLPGDRARLDEIAGCPTQFQARIPGIDHRVHVVGDALFACEVVSAADDYRYAARAGLSAQLSACALPTAIAERCHRAAHALGLPLAGLDLRRTPDGEWFCFEINPSPCFTYFEEHTGQPITEAVASLLSNS